MEDASDLGYHCRDAAEIDFSGMYGLLMRPVLCARHLR